MWPTICGICHLAGVFPVHLGACVVLMSFHSMSWHYWSLRQRRDTTCGLIYALAPLVNIDVDALGTAVPPLHAAQFQAASQVRATPSSQSG